MHRDIVTVPADMDVWELAKRLTASAITGAPVVDSMGEVLGVVSQTDIIKHLREVACSHPRPCDFYADPERDGEGPAGKTVTAKDLMSAPLISASEDTPVHELSRMMLSRGVHRVIITEGRKILGVVTTMDLLKVL